MNCYVISCSAPALHCRYCCFLRGLLY
jgi:hypothetical protein